MDFRALADNLVEPIKQCVTTIPEPTLAALREARDNEEVEGARVQLESMLEAIEVGEREGIPICQDTGTPTFYLQAGTSFSEFGELHLLEDAIREAVRKATELIPIRPNTVDPFTGENPGDNTGRHIPDLAWRVVEGDRLRMIYFPKGGGCTNMSQLKMMNPGRGLKGVKEVVLERIATMAGKPCPPTVVGVGIGGSASLSLQLAKESLLKPVGDRHQEERVAEVERELKQKANQLGVGPMGVGGKTTVLDVKIEYAHRHPASYPVGITPQCWANRRIELEIYPDGSVEVPQ